MERLPQAFTGPFFGEYGTKSQKRQNIESVHETSTNPRSSNSATMFNRPDNLCAKPDSYQLKMSITSDGRSNEKLCKATDRIHASPAMATNMQGIMHYSRKLESLQKAFLVR
jgi:hypothetical protein